MLGLQETLINSSGLLLFRIYSYTTRQLYWKSITKNVENPDTFGDTKPTSKQFQRRDHNGSYKIFRRE